MPAYRRVARASRGICRRVGTPRYRDSAPATEAMPRYSPARLRTSLASLTSTRPHHTHPRAVACSCRCLRSSLFLPALFLLMPTEGGKPALWMECQVQSYDEETQRFSVMYSVRFPGRASPTSHDTSPPKPSPPPSPPLSLSLTHAHTHTHTHTRQQTHQVQTHQVPTQTCTPPLPGGGGGEVDRHR